VSIISAPRAFSSFVFTHFDSIYFVIQVRALQQRQITDALESRQIFFSATVMALMKESLNLHSFKTLNESNRVSAWVILRCTMPVMNHLILGLL